MNTCQSKCIKKRVDTGESEGREETILTRLRIGHGKLNSRLHMIVKDPRGLCDQCQIYENVEHVLVYCTKYKDDYYFNFIYIAHLKKKNIVDQSASQCPEKLTHKQNKNSKNVTMSQLN